MFRVQSLANFHHRCAGERAALTQTETVIGILNVVSFQRENAVRPQRLTNGLGDAFPDPIQVGLRRCDRSRDIGKGQDGDGFGKSDNGRKAQTDREPEASPHFLSV